HTRSKRDWSSDVCSSDLTLSILIDILVMHGLLFTSTGITNGLANLVIVSVAAGNILTPSRMGTFYAALAALCSLGISGWATLVKIGRASCRESGMTGEAR